MLPDRLQARIRAQLALPSPDLEARVLAAELASLANRARERLEQCAALVRIGNDQAALEAAEAEPCLLDLCAWVSFAEADDWRRLCREHGLPPAPAPDDGHVLAVELLYGKPIDESHPLYRDYRQAIRERDDARALAVLRTIVSANPGDANARGELTRLGAKFARDNAGRVTELFAAGDDAGAVDLMDRMERLGVTALAGDPGWEESLARRRRWVESRARARLDELAATAAAEHAEGSWEACASTVGAARTLERNTGLRPGPAQAEALARAEAWAAERVESARAESAAASALAELAAELAELRAETSGAPGAETLRRLGNWQRRARELGDRADPAEVAEAETLRRKVHARLVRRHTLITAAGLLAVALALAAANAALAGFKEEARLRSVLRVAAEQAEAWDLSGAAETLGSLGAAEELDGPALASRDATLALIREREEAGRRLSDELALLVSAGAQGVTAANYADLRRRALALRSQIAQGGPALERRLGPRVGEIPALLARCEETGRSLAPGLRAMVAELETELAKGGALGDPGRARALIGRIRGVLDNPETRTAVDTSLVDRALARADLAEERLRLEERSREEERRLAAAADLKAYLAALREMASAQPPTPESKAAAAVLAAEPALGQLPRGVLGARVGAMWDALGEPAPTETWSPGELAAVARVTDDRVLRGVRRFIVREHSAAGERSTAAVYATGEVTREQRRFQAGTETVTSAQILRRNGEVTAETWSIRRFTNGAVSGEELTEGLPLPELDYLRRFLRSFDPVTRRPGEPLLRTLERVRGESGAPLLRAYHLQELLGAASLRPGISNLTFSPSAQADARELRRLTQNGIAPIDFLFPDKWSDIRPELERFLARPAPPYAEEARFLRTLLAASRDGGLVLAGRVRRDGGAAPRERLPNAVLLGLDSDGRPAALFQSDGEGTLRRLREPLPLTPLLRLALPPAESAARAGQQPPGLAAPAGGWDNLLKGQDL